MPLKNRAGNIKYDKSGKFSLEPNPYFFEELIFPMNTRIISTKPLRPGDPVARDLIGWTNRAYKLGKKNPFIEPQGIHGKTTFEKSD